LSPNGKTALLLLSLSIGLGAASGLLQEYNLSYGLPPGGPTTADLVVIWASMAVSYLVTPLAFYLLGRRDLPGFTTTRGLLLVYAGSIIGQVVAQTPLVLLQIGNFLAPLPFTYVSDFSSSLLLLFTAFSGLALARLRSGQTHAGFTLFALPLVALALALPSNLLFGYGELAIQGTGVIYTGLISLGLVVISFPVQLFVFYYIGKRTSLRGRAFRAFGWLFLGAYVGAVIGTGLAVGLFGQARWATPAGETTSWQNGIVYTDMAPSLVALLQALNPIGALPFFSFFAVTLSQVGETLDEHPRSLAPAAH